MKRIHYFVIFLSIFLLVVTVSQAQTPNGFTVKFNKYVFNPGETLSIDAAYKQAGSAAVLPPSTLELIVENNQGNRTRLRWPMLNGKTSGHLVLPDSLPRGKYTVYMAVQPRFFQVVGKINKPERTGLLNAMLLTSKGEWDTQEVPVEPDGTSTVGNWLFENNATIAFSRAKKESGDLDIRISTRLDSAYEPIALATREIYFGNLAPSTQIDSLGTRIHPDTARFFDQGELLPGVVVKGKNKSRAEQFNEEYSTGLFKSSNEKIFDLIDDQTAISYPSVLSYIQGRVAGLQINPNVGGAVWRGSRVSFYIDEMRVDAQQLTAVSMADIAIVKVYPPPFFGAPGGGSGGAVAIYTRRGSEAELPADRHVFRIKGYTPLTTVLNMQ